MLSEKVAERVIWGSGSRATESLGVHSLWGLSSAVDLLDGVDVAGEGPLKLLLASPGDVRHVLKTLAGRKMDRPIHFYVQEDCVELIARHIVMMRVAMDWELPIKQRSAAFLEIFGNALIQERTERYLSRLGAEQYHVRLGAAALVDDDDELVDLRLLKFRERDLLVSAFASWDASLPQNAFGTQELWERRVRANLGARYDTRQASFDWDYRQGIVKAGAKVVHVKEYKHWRETGVAFEFGDQTYTAPNRTFATYAEGLMKVGKAKGQKRQVRGFWGDSVAGPFVALGSESTHSPLFVVIDEGHGTEQQRHSSTEVATFNVVSFLYKLETASEYEPKSQHQIFSGLGGDDGEAADGTAWRRRALERAQHIVDAFDGVRLVPLCGDLAPALRKAGLGRAALDGAALSLHAASLAESAELFEALKPRARLVVETAKFAAPLSLEQKHLFAQKVHTMAVNRGFVADYATAAAQQHDDEAINALVGGCDTMPRDLDAQRLSFSVPADTPPSPPPLS